MSILIVEDSESYSNYLKEILGKLDDIHIVNCIEQAKKENLDNYSLIILDHMLPDGDSLDLLSVPTNTPMIILTGMDDDKIKAKVLAKGAFAFLKKEDDKFIENLAEVTIRHAEYREIFDILPIGLYRTSIEDGSFLKANMMCAKTLGYSSPEALMKNAKSLDFYYSPEDRTKFINTLKKKGIILNYELHLKLPVTKDEVWIAITGRINEERGYLEGSIMSITERKLLDEELKRYREKEVDKLQAITEAVHQRCEQMEETKLLDLT